MVLKFHPSVAPIKVAVFPLVKNKPELVAKARALHAKLARRYNVAWDATGAIGRRYRRMDEAGAPFCVTVKTARLAAVLGTMAQNEGWR